LVLTKERIRQHRQTWEVHNEQFTNKNKHQQTKLLPNTKLTEDIIQLIIRRDLAGDLAEVLQAAGLIKPHSSLTIAVTICFVHSIKSRMKRKKYSPNF
jgi:hypothetical protein